MNLHRNAPLIALALSTSLLSASAMAQTTSLPRKSGSVHAEFKTMLKDQIKTFRQGVGRIAIAGTSANQQACNVNIYTNRTTTFVTLSTDKGRFYDEFYIDHPSQSFRSILFQNVKKTEAGQTLNVTKKGSSFSIGAQDEKLTVSSKNTQGRSTTCTFNLKTAAYFEGETE